MITISRTLRKQIEGEGERCYPDECCGFLLGGASGDAREVVSILPVENQFDDGEQYHRFKIEPEVFMRAEKKARAGGVSVLGFYHSHPDHPAVPSDYDRDNALPFYSYVIVSVAGGKAADFRSWLLAEDRGSFGEEDITN